MKNNKTGPEDHFCAALLVIMLILTFINVVARKIFLSSMPFVEELTCCGLMILSIMGAATAAKRGAHLGLSLVTDKLKPKSQHIIAFIGDLIAVIFCALLTYYGILMTQNEYVNELETSGMQWPQWLFGMWLPIGALVLAIRYIQLAVLEIKAAAGGSTAGEELPTGEPAEAAPAAEAEAKGDERK